MDLFYYGSQDVPAPQRGARDVPARSRGAFCESCAKPVTARELRSGEAIEAFGLVLCGECRKATSFEEHVEFYFCDRCQVSVPVFRVDTGEALSGDGRILCVSCRERSNRSPLALLLAATAAVLLVGGGLWLALSSSSESGARPDRLESSLQEGLLRALDEELDRWRPGGELRAGHGAENGAAALRTERDQVLERLERAQTSFLLTRAEFKRRMDLLEGESSALHRDLDQLLRDAEAER